ncbi:MerC domain-containing protein [Sphingomonas sp. HMP9]|uniref:MerC domain-containing protein n=1 Tax=Sphingomonas sp. HMP9 TaxID=1517554 RepID=UPI0015965557|nr:MerC domain-containing protein [Sphingomonas sp. HMP9]
MTGSAMCMVHCLALPVLLAAVPALSAVVAIPESFHIWVLLLATPAAAIALFGGHARHAAVWPLGLGIGGLGLMALGAFVVPEGSVETAVTVAGGTLVAMAHIGNLRLRHTCSARRRSCARN